MKHSLSMRLLLVAFLAFGSACSHAVSFMHNDITLDINGTINGFHVAVKSKPSIA